MSVSVTKKMSLSVTKQMSLSVTKHMSLSVTKDLYYLNTVWKKTDSVTFIV